jgi:hypothetical protein
MVTSGERESARAVLAKAKARTARVILCLDGDIEDRIEAAREAFDGAEPDSEKAVELAEALVALEDELEIASQ